MDIADNAAVNKRDAQLLAAAQRQLRETLAANIAAQMVRKPHINTQQKLADLAGVDQATISRALRTLHAVTLDQLAGIAHACGVMAYNLLLDSVPSPTPPEFSTDSEGAQLMERLTGAPKEVKRYRTSGEHERAKSAAAGVHSHSQKPTPRKKRNDSADND